MSPNSSKTEPSRLRLWPALVLLAALWGLKYLPSLFDEPPLSVFMLATILPACNQSMKD